MEQFVSLSYISISWFVLSGKYICVCVLTILYYLFMNNVLGMLFFPNPHGVDSISTLGDVLHPGRNGFTSISVPEVCFSLSSLEVYPVGRFCFYPWVWLCGCGWSAQDSTYPGRVLEWFMFRLWFDWNIIYCNNISELIDFIIWILVCNIHYLIER